MTDDGLRGYGQWRRCLQIWLELDAWANTEGWLGARSGDRQCNRERSPVRSVIYAHAYGLVKGVTFSSGVEGLCPSEENFRITPGKGVSCIFLLTYSFIWRG